MNLSDISIKKPVFAWMLMAALIVFGLISFGRMGVSQMPDVDFPVLSISVNWIGAAPETIESAVVDVLEDAVMTVEGIRDVRSSCQEGSASISIEFELDRNIDAALQEVQAKIAQAQRRLPLDIDPPVVTKSNPEDQPILWVALSGGALREKILFVRDYLKDSFTTVTGVGDVRLGGYVDPNMRIWLDTDRMRRQEIGVDDVTAAVQAGNVLTPSGYMMNGPKETNIRVLSEISSQEAFKSLVIPTRNGAPIWGTIRIGDVAEVEEGLADIRRISRHNGRSAVGMGIIKQRGSNAVSVGRGIKEHVQKIKGALPPGMSMGMVNDSTRFIEQSTNELLFTLGLSALLTSIVCWLFLGSWSTALNVILAIPTSLIGAFIFLRAFGFTVNTFTLLALSLSIGIVVDDAIMVLENIVRYFEKGMNRVKASLIGAREISGAATASSVAILAIFIPVVFMKGIVGKFFFQFGIAMTVSVMLSLLEALTLAPMRCAQFLQKPKEQAISRAVDHFMEALAKAYRKFLNWALDHRWKIVLSSLVLFAASLLIMKGLRQEFVPPQDQSRFLATIQLPMGASLESTDSVFKKAEEITMGRPEVKDLFVAIGGFQGGLVNQGNMFITLKDPEDRGISPPFKKSPSQQQFMAYLREEFNKLPGVKRATLLDLSSSGFTSSRGYPIQFSLQGPDWTKLGDLSQKLMDQMKASGLMQDVDSDFNPNMPELRVVPDRVAAAQRGVSVSKIATTIGAMVGSLRVGRYTDGSGHSSDIRIRLRDKDSRTIDDIRKIQIRNYRGEMIPLSELVQFEPTGSLLTITRYNRERGISLFASMVPGQSQSKALEYVENMAAKTLPEGYRIVMSGSSKTFRESFESLGFALILGILVAYMALGAQFNSFIHPLVILLALPFSITGAFIALKLFGISINIYSMIGILLLMGIVKKNSILLVDFTNRMREEGLNVRDALLKACPLRLRPILMTSIATVAGAIPVAFGVGPSADTTRPMAVVVIGGVILSTALTLVVVPCGYSLMSRLERRQEFKES